MLKKKIVHSVCSNKGDVDKEEIDFKVNHPHVDALKHGAACKPTFHGSPDDKNSGGEEQYFCVKCSDFFKNLKFPTQFTKNKGVFFVFITSGKLSLKIGYDSYIAIKDQLLIIQPLKPFQIEKCSEDLQGYILYIKENSVLGNMGNHSMIFNLDFLDTWSNSLYSIDHIPIEFIENIFKRIAWQNKKTSLNIVNAYVITLLLEINNLYNHISNPNRAAIDLSRKFKKEIYNNLHLQLSITDYASKLSVTPNHLNKSVKSVTGYSALILISKMKMIEAKYLLMTIDLTIADISEKIGFSDVSYFSRFFKKHEGVTPTEYRKMIGLS